MSALHVEDSYLISFCHRHADLILHTVSPLLWVALFILFIDRETLLQTWYMPFLGIVAAFLANAVPIGGGIVYIPALALLGSEVTLGAAFTIATMPIGNGLFGFLRWLKKDPSTIIWEAFPYTVIPSWIGSFLAMTMLPPVEVYWIKIGFAFFCLALCVLVLLSTYRGGLRNVISLPSRHAHPSVEILPTLEEVRKEQADLLGFEQLPTSTEEEELLVDIEATETTKAEPVYIPQNVEKDWSTVVAVSFLGGLLLVPNIGVGPALLTYFLLASMHYTDQQAIVTGIITGGWVCILPLGVNALVLNNVPVKLWLMVLPGVFLGAKYAPMLIDWVGSERVMYAFATFLFASALLFFFH
jgi:uncharacterized membrane protein YfcA